VEQETKTGASLGCLGGSFYVGIPSKTHWVLLVMCPDVLSLAIHWWCVARLQATCPQPETTKPHIKTTGVRTKYLDLGIHHNILYHTTYYSASHR